MGFNPIVLELQQKILLSNNFDEPLAIIINILSKNTTTQLKLLDLLFIPKQKYQLIKHFLELKKTGIHVQARSR